MPCSKPLNAWQSPTPKSNGKKRIAFKQEHIGLEALPLQIPCGQCWSCRLERSRQWALRCVHEASLHPDNMFLTLTYNEESLPADGGLDKTHFQKFMKRYRQHLERNEGGQKIRYYMCGEYGDQTNRPHYHALIFGHNFSDKTLFRKTDSGHNLYTSTILDNLWTHGFCNIGELTFESAAYTARYIMKKVKSHDEKRSIKYLGNEISPEEWQAYSRVNPDTGEAHYVLQEYTNMSRRPGIGQGWYAKYGEETYRDDYIIERGMKMQPPKYYDEQYPDIKTIKDKRITRARMRAEHNTPERLAVKEKVKRAQMRFLKRSLKEY